MTTGQPAPPGSEHEELAPVGLRDALRGDPFGIASRRPPTDPDEPADRAALLRLVLVVAVLIAVSFAAGVGVTVLLVLALVVCIVLHELGHFLTAKAAGIKVTEFFFGFGPRLWSVKRGETEYGIKALPLGGYCRIIGMHNLEEVDPEDEPRTYRQKPMWRRLSVAAAGSAMHFLIAVVVLFAMFFWTGDSSGYLPIPGSSPVTSIERLTNGASPAEKAGFHLGDRIQSIDGRHFATFTAMRTYIERRPARRLTVVVERGEHDLTLHPRTANLELVAVSGPVGSALRTKRPTGFLGIEVSDVVHSSLGASISEAGGAWVHDAALTLDALGRLATFHGIHSYLQMLTSQKAANAAAHNPNSVRFESPVGVVRLLHTAAGDGLATVLYLLAVINLSLGIFNLIPLLPLDGGHVAIALYEGARSRRRRRYHADVAKLLPLFYLAMVLIIFIAASSLFLDLRSLLA
ncbi:MAG TPA: site-2 protease family protein [Acidimicrobiales bacterium]|nr:site-2 protease family protein [Acidimicrobiales bacterium]